MGRTISTATAGGSRDFRSRILDFGLESHRLASKAWTIQNTKSEIPNQEGLGGRSTTDKYAPDDVRQGFTGYINDEETGLDYAQARMYKKDLGRFTGGDPVLITPYRLNSPQSINLYSYVANTPTKFTDPTGSIIRFRNEDDAKKAVELYKNGLSPEQQSAVSYEQKDGKFVLKIDPELAKKSGAESLLGRLSFVATTDRVAVLDFVGNNTKFEIIEFGTESLKKETSMRELIGETSGRVKDLAGLTLPEFGDKDHKKYNSGLSNSAEKGVSRILINTESQYLSPTAAIYAETLAHFQTFAETGDAVKASHPAVNEDEKAIVSAVGNNRILNEEKVKLLKSPPKKP